MFMSFDMNQITQMLNNLPYPISKNDLVQMARQYGANDQTVNALSQNLPDRTFNSPQDLMSCMGGMSSGAMGGIGGTTQPQQDQGWMGQGQQDQGWMGQQGQQDQGQVGGWMGQQGQQDQDQGQMGSF